MTPRTATPLDSIPAWLVVLLAAAWILPGLVGHEPWKPDEAYSFGLVYHILQSGDLVVPTLAGEPFMEKPPLFYATAALSAKIFSGVLPLHDGARLASGFYIALTLLFAGLAARELYRQGRAAVLALLACLGLAPWAHLLITDTALLAGLALGLCGLALGQRRPVAGGLCLGTGAGMAFLSKGLLGPGLLGLTALVLPALHRAWRTRAHLTSLLVAFAASLPWLLIWPVALYSRSPELFGVWLWDNNFGRFLGSSRLGPRQEAWFYLRALAWFSWPVWLLAPWGLWRAGRNGLRRPEILLPLVFFAVALLALAAAADAREVYALPLLLPLALLAVPALGVLPARVATLLYGLGVVAAFVVLLAVWGVWFAPALLPLLELTGPAATPTAVVAVLLSVGSLAVLYAGRRSPARQLLAWAVTVTLLTGLTLTLLLDALDGQKSYRATMQSLRGALPASYDCVASEGLGEPQRAMLEYYAGVRTQRLARVTRADCELLLRQEKPGDPPGADARRWRLVWEGRRPGDKKEIFRFYRAAAAPG